MRLAAVHFTPALGAPAQNRDALLALAEEAARGADLAVLPELATTGFSLSPERASEWAEDLEGLTLSALRAVAQSEACVIAAGLCLREGPLLRNAQVLVDADGEVAGVYAKRHLWGSDATWATAGERHGAVTSTRCGPVGQLICADLGHLETVRQVALQRPRVLAFSTAWVGEGEPLPLSWQIALRLMDPAPLVVANRGGAEDSLVFEDPSAILSFPHGGVIGARGDAPYVLRWELP